MKLLEKKSDSVEIEISIKEMNIIYDILNEASNGIGYLEFKKYLKINEEKVKCLLDTIHKFLDKNREGLLVPIPEIKDMAENLGDNWLMCPLCQDVWVSHSKFEMVRCPKCNDRLHNPQFSPQSLSMRFIVKESSLINIQFSIDELHIIRQALSEVCHGVDLWEFEIVTGIENEEIRHLLKTVNEIS